MIKKNNAKYIKESKERLKAKNKLLLDSGKFVLENPNLTVKELINKSYITDIKGYENILNKKLKDLTIVHINQIKKIFHQRMILQNKMEKGMNVRSFIENHPETRVSQLIEISPHKVDVSKYELIKNKKLKELTMESHRLIFELFNKNRLLREEIESGRNMISLINEHPYLIISDLLEISPYKVNPKKYKHIKDLKLKEVKMEDHQLIYDLFNEKISDEQKRKDLERLIKTLTKTRIEDQKIIRKNSQKKMVLRVRHSEKSAIYLLELLRTIEREHKDWSSQKFSELQYKGTITNKFKKMFSELTVKEVHDLFYRSSDIIKGNLRDRKRTLGFK